MSARALFAVAALVVVLAAGRTSGEPADQPAGPDAPAGSPVSFRPPVHNALDMEVETMCDEQGRAYEIKPDTPPAYERAAEMCGNLQRGLEDAGLTSLEDFERKHGGR